MFGPVNALFSGFAFCGVIVAILLQRQELTLQREELSHTREEIRGQKEQLVLQNFENTFFSLLRIQNEITGEFEIHRINMPTSKGRSTFRYLCEFLEDTYQKSDAVESYNHFYNNHRPKLGPYFQNLYNIIKFVDLSDVEDKKFYTNIVRAQLSSYELVILFYNTLSPYGEKFKPLVEKYALLKMLPIGLLLDPKHEELHMPEVYGRG